MCLFLSVSCCSFSQKKTIFFSLSSLKVNDINDVPSDILVSNSHIAESASVGIVVATLTTVDHDKSQSHTYSLLDDAGKAAFRKY